MLKDKKREVESFVSDLISLVLMVCGTLMAVANGLIPSLGAIIYGKLIDELVVQSNVSCTWNETVTTIKLTNITKLQFLYPTKTRIAINDTKSIKVLSNGSRIRLEVVGLDRKVLKEVEIHDQEQNGMAVMLNATAFNGSKFISINVTGAEVQMVVLEENMEGKKRVQERETANVNKSNINATRTEENKTKTYETWIKEKGKSQNEEKATTIEKGSEKGKYNSAKMRNKKNNKMTEQGTEGNSTRSKQGKNNEESRPEKAGSGKIESTDTISKRTTYFGRKLSSISRSHSYSKLVVKNKTEKAMKETYRASIRRKISSSGLKMGVGLFGEDKLGPSCNETDQTMAENTAHIRNLVQANVAEATVRNTRDTQEFGTLVTMSSDINLASKSTRSVPSDREGLSPKSGNSTKKTQHSKTVPRETRNIKYTVRNVTENCHLFEIRIEENMKKYAWYYVYAALGTLVFAYGQMVFWNIASERGVRNLSEDMTESAMEKDPGYYDTKTFEGAVKLEDLSDPLGTVSKSELDALSGGLGGEIAFLIQTVSSATSGFAVSFVQNWKITLVMMAAAPLLGIVQGIGYKVDSFVSAQKDEMMRRASSLARKSLGSIKTVVAYAGEKLEKARYSGKIEASNNLSKIKSVIQAMKKGFTALITFGFLGLGFWYSSSLLPGGSVTPGALMTIFMAIIGGVMQVLGTVEQIDDVAHARTALFSMFGISEEEGEAQFNTATGQLEKVLGKLDVFNVYFHYPSRPEYQILKSINLTIEEGQTVALLGDKGCGKSTLIKLLQRIYDPQMGKVRLDGYDIRYLNRRWFRRQVGIVHKKPEFFNTSIAENIAFGKEGCTLKQIVRAATYSGADEFIRTLPRGYDTVLSDNGSPLTQYQKHSLALARAMIRNPRILLWEEDLSIMEKASIDVLTNYLEKARRGRTTVISTSHVSLARIADVIVVLHNGEIMEAGTPEELLKSGGAFAYLATLQYFEAETLNQEKLLKEVQISSSLTTIDQGVEAMESTLIQSQDHAKEHVKGFMSQLRRRIQETLHEGEAAYKMIRMQLQDLPLLLSGALGAGISGMVAPGFAYLFGEIQKVLNDSARVAREGIFWASMFVVLGAVVGFGGTIEKFMLSFASDKLRSRLQQMAFDLAINKNSIPQVPGISSMPSPFIGEIRGECPGLASAGLPMPPSLVSGQLPSAGGLPSFGPGQLHIPGLEGGQVPLRAGLPLLGLSSGEGAGSGTVGQQLSLNGLPSSATLPGFEAIGAGQLPVPSLPIGQISRTVPGGLLEGVAGRDYPGPGKSVLPNQGLSGIGESIDSLPRVSGMSIGQLSGLQGSIGVPGLGTVETGQLPIQELSTGQILSSDILPIQGIPLGGTGQGLQGIGMPVLPSQGLLGINDLANSLPQVRGVSVGQLSESLSPAGLSSQILRLESGLPILSRLPAGQLPSTDRIPIPRFPLGEQIGQRVPVVGTSTLPSQGLPGISNSVTSLSQTPRLSVGQLSGVLPPAGLASQDVLSGLGFGSNLPIVTGSPGQFPSTTGIPLPRMPFGDQDGLNIPEVGTSALPSGIANLITSLPQVTDDAVGNIPGRLHQAGLSALGSGSNFPRVPTLSSGQLVSSAGQISSADVLPTQGISLRGEIGQGLQFLATSVLPPEGLPAISNSANSLPQVPVVSVGQLIGVLPPAGSASRDISSGVGLGSNLPVVASLTAGLPTSKGKTNPVIASAMGGIPDQLSAAGLQRGQFVPVDALPVPGIPLSGVTGQGISAGSTTGASVPGLPGAFSGVPENTAGFAGSLLPGSSSIPLGNSNQLQGMGRPLQVSEPNLLPLPDPQKQADLIIEQIEKDVEAALQNSIGKYLGTQVQETISSVSTLAMAFYNGWKMTLVVLAGLPIIALANRMQQNETEASAEPEGVGKLMSTSFKKMETITALGLESEFTKKYKEAIMEKYKHALKKIIASGFAFAIGQAMVFFIYAGALRFGCHLISIRDMTAIQVLGVLMTVLFGSYATTSSRAPSHSSTLAEESLDRLFDEETTKIEEQIGDKLNQVKGNLDFEHVELLDPLQKGGPLLSEFHLKICKGQTLAIVPLDNEILNPLEFLVERFYDPLRGRLLLDEIDIRSLDLSWLRSQHAVVSYRSVLTHCSIAENIAYSDNSREVSRREIEDAAYSAFAHAFIIELPQGYDTVPDEYQITLTKSQKQRIAIARALVRRPAIVIIEELEEDDKAVNVATQILSRGRTSLILTRRRATVEAADRIVLMYRGHVIEQGTVEELINLRRLYYLLSNLENLEYL